MRHQYSQVHEPRQPGEEEDYTYESLPWLDLGRVAIYLVTFAFMFTFARHFFAVLF